MRLTRLRKNLGRFVSAVADLDVEESVSRCTLFSSAFDYGIQGVLGVLALASLYVKYRCFDPPHRKFNTWGFDTTKQALGGVLSHFMNVGMAKVLHHSIHRWGTRTADECDFYFINCLAELVFGLLILRLLLAAYHIVVFSVFRAGDAVRQTGDYGDPPEVRTLAIQSIVWVILVVVMKIFLFVVELALVAKLDVTSHWLLTPLDPFPKVKLVIVMVITPLLLNAVAFWVIDIWIQKRTPPPHAAEPGLSKPHRKDGKGDAAVGAVVRVWHRQPSC